MKGIKIIGNLVYREKGEWTPQIHKFLKYLHEHNFNCVPKPIGFDKDDHEIVSFLDGETFDYPLAEKARSLTILISSAKLLRAFHDVSAPIFK